MPPNVGAIAFTVRMNASGSVSVDFDVEGVDVGVSFEEHAFTFHDGFACQSSDIAQSQDGRAVRNDCYQIAFVRVTVNLFGVSFDFAARSCDAGE